MSGRLVAAITTMPASPPKPSISTSSAFSVCSRSSLPWPTPAPRLRPAASSSSMKIIAGAILRALAKRSRTRAAPTPTSDSTKSEPESEKKAASASPAVALASSVLPVPGGPTSSTPFGARAPTVGVFARVGEVVADLAQLGHRFAGAGDVVEGGAVGRVFAALAALAGELREAGEGAGAAVLAEPREEHEQADEQQDRDQELDEDLLRGLVRLLVDGDRPRRFRSALDQRRWSARRSSGRRRRAVRPLAVSTTTRESWSSRVATVDLFVFGQLGDLG